MIKKYKNSIIGAAIVAFVLSIINIKVRLDGVKPMLLGERFLPGIGGWIEIFIISIYAGYIIHKMITTRNTAKWRKLTWTIFSVVFFAQLLLALLGFDMFLMKHSFHLPIPALIIGGSVYNLNFGFMPILFLSTVILSGPAWCSQLCYFGALDLQASSGLGKPHKIKNKALLKSTFLIIVITGAVVLRILNLSYFWTAIIASLFGVVGIFVILYYSRKKKMMYHCTTFCPIGTVLQYVKYINPFRMYIEQSACTLCMQCTPTCKYDALNPEDIKAGKPGLSCTYCGDCISSCHSSSIKYKFFNIKGQRAQNIWIVLTIVLHAIFLALARI